MLGRETVAGQRNPLVAEGFKALVTGLFAYIGYASGGLLMVTIINANAPSSGAAPVDIEAAGTNFKMQFMFVVALIVNTLVIFWAARRWQGHQIPLWVIFLLFWGVDALVPWLYQTIVFRSSYIPTVILLGFFPALIITISIRLNYHRAVVHERRFV